MIVYTENFTILEELPFMLFICYPSSANAIKITINYESIIIFM